MKNSNPADFLKQTLISKTAQKAEKNTDSVADDDFDIVDVVPIPMHGDRMVRLRTLEEALNDFDPSGDALDDSVDGPVMGYFVQVKPRTVRPAPKQEPFETSFEPSVEMSLRSMASAAFLTLLMAASYSIIRIWPRFAVFTAICLY